jgi:hypothetical protein
MPLFLSTEWIRELDAAVRASEGLRAEEGSAPVVIEQRITDTPFGDVTYHAVLGVETCIVPGAADAADIVLVTDYDTAIELHHGTLNAQHAIAAGRMKLRGHVEVLLRRAEMLRALGDVFRDMRTTTEAAERPETHR